MHVSMDHGAANFNQYNYSTTPVPGTHETSRKIRPNNFKTQRTRRPTERLCLPEITGELHS